MSVDRPYTETLHKRASALFPGGVNSPVRAWTGFGKTPLVVQRGEGERIFDADGHSYIDFCGSWGALIHGHAHPYVVERVQKRVAEGSSFGITTPLEISLAELVRSHIPSMEKMRFVSSGSEATMSAVRLARGYTGRELLVKFSGHYHGHADAFLVEAGSGALSLPASSGLPVDLVSKTLLLPFNDFTACEALFRERGEEIAALIVEPVAANMGVVPPLPGFLDQLRLWTARAGALLIFDEVITGFRLGLGGAQARYGVTPDLTCLGKIVGGGFPAAAFGGRREIMESLAPLGAVYQAGTLSANPVAMEAGLATLELCSQNPYFYDLLERRTNRITEPVRAWAAAQGAPVVVQQVGSLFTLFLGRSSPLKNLQEVKACENEAYRALFLSLLEEGIYLSPSPYEAHFVSSAHTEESLDKTAALLLYFLEKRYLS